MSRYDGGMTEPAVIPMLSYRDGARALAWLAEAFGFIELRRMTAPDGRSRTPR